MKTTSSSMFSSSEVKLNNPNASRLADMTLTELQEIAIKQQQQIEINQQLLLAKEKRLKILKLEEQRNQQLSLLSQSSFANNQMMGNPNKTPESSNKLENLKQNVLGQELKIFKLKELRNQILKHKLSNSNMSSELDLIKSLFSKKERELCEAVKNVAELTKQIDQLRKIKTFSNATNGNQFVKSDFKNGQGNVSASELEKLKQELQIRNKLNEQQSKKIMQQHEAFNQKQLEVVTLDKRIEELQTRISNKKILSDQLNQSYSNLNGNNVQQQQQQQQKNNPTNHGYVNSFSNRQEYAEEEEENIQQHRGSNDEIENEFMDNQQSDNSSTNQKYGFSSPTKPNAKFATKQEIANTYMNKFGSEAYQRYQMNSIKVLQQQNHHHQQQQQQQNRQFNQILGANENQPTTISSHVKRSSVDETDLASPQQQQQQNGQHTSNQNIKNMDFQTTDPSTLPSHLTHEFDKIKYLPDMVKTIKKRHSISEIEGSSHHVPPLIFQRMIQNHHKNFLDQKQMQLKQIKETEQLSPDTEKRREEQEANKAEGEMKMKQQVDVSRVEDAEVLENEVVNEFENETPVVRSTKPIIKIPSNLPTEQQKKRRVNFNPHALLLDAAVEGELDLVMKCAKLVQDVSEPNDEGITALHNSVCAGHFDIVKFLVEFGCDINFADNDGWTPLHCAASCNNLPMVKFLIEHGASVFASTVSDNETAIKKCEEDEDGFEACFEYLSDAQENLGSQSYKSGHVYTLYSYEAVNEDELSFKCGEEIKILSKNDDDEKNEDCDGWWTARSLKENREGLVPNNFLGLFPRVQGNKKSNQHESTMC